MSRPSQLEVLQIKRAPLKARLVEIGDMCPGSLVERTQRLIEQEHGGLQHQRSCQGHTLFLATAQLMGIAILLESHSRWRPSVR